MATNSPEKQRSYNKRYAARHPEKRRARATAFRRKNPDKTSAYDRKYRYGVTPEQFAVLVARQGGKCAVCGASDPLCLDHCHRDGRIRGLLCNRCNLGLGWFRDDYDLLVAAAHYLRNS